MQLTQALEEDIAEDSAKNIIEHTAKNVSKNIAKGITADLAADLAKDARNNVGKDTETNTEINTETNIETNTDRSVTPSPKIQRSEAIDLILSIFVGSGLAFQIPADLEQRYQLAHDYLAEVVHNYYVQRFGDPFEALQREKSLHNLTERELRDTLEKLQVALDRATQARHEAEVAQIEAAVRSSQVLFLFDDRREALSAALKAGRRLRTVEVPLGLNFVVLDALRRAVYGAQQIDRLRGHEGWVDSLAISPQGCVLASGGSDGTVRLWWLQTGQRHCLKPSCDWIESVAFSPDGRWLAVAGDRSVFLWHFERGIDRWSQAVGEQTELAKPSRTISPRSDWVRSLAFSAANDQLAIGCHDGTIDLVSLLSPDPESRIDRNLNGFSTDPLYSSAVPDSAIKALAFLNNDRQLVIGTLDGNVLLWEFARDRWQIIGEHDAEIVDITIEHRHVWAGSNNGAICRWPLDGTGINDLDGVKYRQGEDIASFRVDPLRQRIAVGEISGTVRVWDMNGRELENFTAHRSAVRALCLAPDGRSILSGSDDRTISLWQFADREPGTICQHDRWIACVALSEDGRYGLSADGNGEIAIWNPVPSFDIARSAQIQDPILYRWQGFDRPIRNAVLRPLLTPSASQPSSSQAFSETSETSKTSPQSWEAVAIDRVGITRIWTIDGQLKRELPPPINLELAWTGVTIQDAIYASRDGRVWLTDRHGQVWLALNCQHVTPPSEHYSGSPESLESPESPESPGLDICDICISHDRRQLAIGHRSGIVELWAINPVSNTAAFLYPIVTHTRAIGCLAFSPDDQLLAIGDYDRGLSVWTLATRQSRLLAGHAAAVNSICFSRSGHVLISGSYDRTIRFWNSNTGNLLHTITDPTHAIDSLCLIPDRRAIVSGCRDHSVRLWNFELEDLITRGEAMLARGSHSGSSPSPSPPP